MADKQDIFEKLKYPRSWKMEGIDRAHLFAFHFPSFLPDFPKSACEAKIEVRKKSNWEIGFKKISKLATFVIQGKNTRPKKKKTPRRSEGY